jgi:hypothetical protein
VNFMSIRADDPEKVTCSVYNSAAYQMAVGDSVHWYYSFTDGAAGAGNGYQVTFGNTATTQQPSPALWAGCICDQPIPAGGWGEVQCWGPHSAAKISNCNTAPFSSAAYQVTTNTYADWQPVVLRPLNAFGIVAGVTNAGYLAPMAQVSTITTEAAFDARPYWMGGYAIPLANRAATMDAGSTGAAAVFIKAL